MTCSSCHNQVAYICEECESKDRKELRYRVALRCAEISESTNSHGVFIGDLIRREFKIPGGIGNAE